MAEAAGRSAAARNDERIGAQREPRGESTVLIELEVKDDWLDKLVIDRLERERQAALDACNYPNAIAIDHVLLLLKGEW